MTWVVTYLGPLGIRRVATDAPSRKHAAVQFRGLRILGIRLQGEKPSPRSKWRDLSMLGVASR